MVAETGVGEDRRALLGGAGVLVLAEVEGQAHEFALWVWGRSVGGTVEQVVTVPEGWTTADGRTGGPATMRR
ncbi:hypothetical protein GCM10009593_38870 [Microlunatus antarcticus]